MSAHPLSFTIDLEDPTTAYAAKGRYVGLTHALLDQFAAHQIRATFFTVGRVAEAAPALVQRISAEGHEVAYHSHAHCPLTEETQTRFQEETRRDKDMLEQLTGKAVTGFRAPCYSLTPRTVWALPCLKALGFVYSSSLMPTRLSRFGFPNVPQTPFLWPNGLVEVPLPVHSVGPLDIPYLGGIYLYSLPLFLVKRWRETAPPDALLWTYAHPYDFDVTEPFHPMPHTPWWVSAVLWQARRRAVRKVAALREMGAGLPLGERVMALRQSTAIPQLDLGGCL